MKCMGLAITISIIIIVAGCANQPVVYSNASESQIDGTTKETTSTSLKEMYREHSNKEICLLQAAILRIQLGEKEQQVAATGNNEVSPTPLGSKIDGMTYEEIIAFSGKYPDKVTAICRD